MVALSNEELEEIVNDLEARLNEVEHIIGKILEKVGVPDE